MGRDEEKHSTVEGAWTITADFPSNQNHGLALKFVKTYEGHSTDFRLQSVTDGAGKKLNYEWYSDELRIGDKDEYVSGRQTYVIKYTQRDATKHYQDTGRDEFY